MAVIVSISSAPPHVSLHYFARKVLNLQTDDGAGHDRRLPVVVLPAAVSEAFMAQSSSLLRCSVRQGGSSRVGPLAVRGHNCNPPGREITR